MNDAVPTLLARNDSGTDTEKTETWPEKGHSASSGSNLFIIPRGEVLLS